MLTTSQVQLWGDFAVEEGQRGYWRIGPLELWLSHLRGEWNLHYHQQDDALDSSAQVELPADGAPPEEATQLRFSFQRPARRLSLLPLLADRAMIIKPDAPLFVPSGEAATFFISTPVWVRVGLEHAGRLFELPSHRPSDTWFGPSTTVGELCYSSHTAARLSLDELPFRPHRAVTPLVIHNRAEDALLFEKVKLPVQYLSLYQSETQFLWTEAVTLKHEEPGDLAALDLGNRAPPQAGRSVKLASARQSAGQNIVLRAFSKLFRHE